MPGATFEWGFADPISGGITAMNTTTKLGAAALAFGLSGAAVAQVAQSSVTLSGVIDTGVSWTNHAGNGSQSLTGVSDSILGVSNFGLSGKEDLGGGVNALFNLQAGFNPSNGRMSSNGTLFSRNSYVGLSSSSGTLTVGKQWNFNDDWLVGSVFKGGYNSGSIFKFSEFDAVSELYNNTVKYVSPSLGGVQLGAMYGFGETAGSVSQGSLFNLAARYDGGPLYLAASYDQERDSSGTGSLYKLITVGGSYTFGAVKLRLGAARADVGGAGAFQSIPSMSARKATAVEGGVDYAFTSAFTASADVLYRRNTTLSNSSTVYRLLGLYSLSKRTTLVANVAYLKNSANATEALVNTTSGAIGGGVAGMSQTSVALGVRHTF